MHRTCRHSRDAGESERLASRSLNAGAQKDDRFTVCVDAAIHRCPIVTREPTSEELDDPEVAVVDIGGVHDPLRSRSSGSGPVSSKSYPFDIEQLTQLTTLDLSHARLRRFPRFDLPRLSIMQSLLAKGPRVDPDVWRRAEAGANTSWYVRTRG